LGSKSKLTTYDPLVLRSYADKLYQEARWVTLTTALRYLAGMFLFSFVPVWVLHTSHTAFQNDEAYSIGIGASVVLMIAATMVGVERGMSRAFQLKLEAQQTLCQVAIEQNTHSEPTWRAPGEPLVR
jgi:hypothetical protein